ncbi:MAG: PIG-L deacetylase family protein [Chloroflexota bacterium]
MNPDEIRPRLLAISAHPDDVEFTSGGSLARWADEGWIIHLIVCTDGSKGSQSKEDDPQTLAAVRHAEQEEAARALGVRRLIWLGYPDGELAQASGLLEQLTRHIRLLRPNRLLVWDAWRPYQLHPDHRAAGLVAMDAVLAARNPHFFPEQLAEGVKPYQMEEAYLYGSDQSDQVIDITATFERKMAAIGCHRSQVDNPCDLAKQMSHCNQGHGKKNNYTYAEVFKVLRPFCDT